MPYDNSKLRLERFDAQVSYHAAYQFWNVRGVLAERWAHGPLFGATNDTTPGQVALLPGDQPGEEVSDQRLLAIYGLRASVISAEGEKWVPEAQKITDEWMGDALQVLKPKRVVRAAVSLFGLYPVDDPVQASRKLRGWAYRSATLDAVLPPSAQKHRDRFHAALDFLVPEGDSGTGLSVIIGAVGPPHRGTFFVHEDADRDSRWWMGFRVDRREVDTDGLQDALGTLSNISKTVHADYEHLTNVVLREIIS